ncbi:MAG TPA: C40 family peptidase [Alphaproteobacteria bacterium]|nr:C40 family peptidase [Alphaproteobacteria bacterium]
MNTPGSPALLRVICGSTALRRAPADDAPLDTQMLFGEIFAVEQEQHGWAKGVAALDHYPGFVRMDALGPLGPLPTHIVRVPRTFVYRDADLKSPMLMWLGMNAKLALGGNENGFCRLENAGWVFAAHTAPVGVHAADFVSAAEMFLGTPYLWGGRDGLGLDCSGLLQTALHCAGIDCPRDTYQQVELGAPQPLDRRALQRGDLIFWKGHVGMMRDAATLLHANAYHMQTVSEPLSDAVARIEQGGSQITAIRRLVKPGG